MTLENNASISLRAEMESKTLTDTKCEHGRLWEIGEDFDQDGRLVRLVRCQRCGLLIRKSSLLGFAEPAPTLEVSVDNELRTKILQLDAAKAKELGIGKSTHHYLRRKARLGKSFRVYGKVRKKLSILTI